MDEEGWLYFVGRIKDSIRRRGQNISAYELECLIEEHEDVLEVTAITVPSELGEDEVKVVVVPKPGRRIEARAMASYLGRDPEATGVRTRV